MPIFKRLYYLRRYASVRLECVMRGAVVLQVKPYLCNVHTSMSDTVIVAVLGCELFCSIHHAGFAREVLKYLLRNATNFYVNCNIDYR